MTGRSVSRILSGACPSVRRLSAPNRVRPTHRGDHSSGSRIASGLKRPTRGLYRAGPALPSYLALHHAGFAVPRALPPERWALTPPFHPCPAQPACERRAEGFPPACHRGFRGSLALTASCAGGLFSVALSVAESSQTRPPGVTRRVALQSDHRKTSDRGVRTFLQAEHREMLAQRSPDLPASSIIRGAPPSSTRDLVMKWCEQVPTRPGQIITRLTCPGAEPKMPAQRPPLRSAQAAMPSPPKGGFTLHDRPNHLALPHCRRTGWRRHGSRVHGRGHQAWPARGAEIPARGAILRRGGPRTLPARSSRRLRAESPAYLHHPRH